MSSNQPPTDLNTAITTTCQCLYQFLPMNGNGRLDDNGHVLLVQPMYDEYTREARQEECGL